MLLTAQANDLPVAAWLRTELEGVRVRLHRELRSELACVNNLVRHVEAFGGKMLRPTLVLVTGLATSTVGLGDPVRSAAPAGAVATGNGHPDLRQPMMAEPIVAFDQAVTDEHRILATVMEMTHLATLVHDDVLDESSVRRGGATLNSLRGNEAAVMLGDYLISHAYRLCSSLDRQWIAEMVADTTNMVCEGELLQLSNRENWALDEEVYFEIIQRKTASLCGACCAIGAELSGAGEQITSGMRRFGVKVGMAFQIVDDLMDLMGEESIVGKSVHRDLVKGKSTLPLLHVLQQSGGARLRGLIERMVASPADPADLQELRRLIAQGRGEDYARQRAERLINEALAELRVLPSGPGREFLEYLAGRVLTRKY
ncbi:MAG: polyprenyl synthetase family protein [Phycisphaeraceae bacterium]|nr:polyprenyl synthetase family protein [Phycisphaeraceae bacterium]